MQVNAQGKYFNHHYFVNVDYVVSSNSNNVKASRPLFAGNGQSAGIAHRWGGRYGIYSTVQYAFGKTNQDGINSFAQSFKSLSPIEIKQSSKNWSVLEVMTGPNFLPIKKVPLNISVLGGVGFITNPNTFLIQQNDNGTIGKTYYAAKEKDIIAKWNVKAMYIMNKKAKNTFMAFTASYGSSGASVGMAVAYGGNCCIFGCPNWIGCKAKPYKAVDSQ